MSDFFDNDFNLDTSFQRISFMSFLDELLLLDDFLDENILCFLSVGNYLNEKGLLDSFLSLSKCLSRDVLFFNTRSLLILNLSTLALGDGDSFVFVWNSSIGLLLM